MKNLIIKYLLGDEASTREDYAGWDRDVKGSRKPPIVDVDGTDDRDNQDGDETDER